DHVRGWCRDGGVNALVAPNFALGAVLMMRFAASAARHFDTAEIVERHHEQKLDAPSGTALRTARLMNDARERPWRSPDGGDGSRGRDEGGIRVHSLRVPGSVAHQEVVLGAAGQTLTIRHDSIDRSSFMPGVVLAIERVRDLDGLVVGLENVLDL
ncbi:MAG TPA: 4-hydroxy-tetrahydrodipicolinate reductase, partial [Actinomycetota bacterium]|nr:4-hydroxy-tetrahydrodipicolinate reductase [Actinomycetota bacterium]